MTESITQAIKDVGEKPGFAARMRARAPKIITDNAPRIVGMMKICSSIVTITFPDNKLFKAAGAGFIGAFGTMATFGKKKTEAQKEKIRQEEVNKPPPEGRVGEYFYKLRQPRKYPIESATSIAMVSSTLWSASGVFGKDIPRAVSGLLSLTSDTNIVFSKEKIGEKKANPHKKGTLRYRVTELRNRPVLLSSSLNIACDITSLVGGAYQYFIKNKGEAFSKDKIANFLIGLILLTANIFQAIFVDKNDYNIEASAE